ncbi:Uncharacterised protein [Serratia sp. 2880STDY5682894]|nr:Uncharacterised protein [Serratia sp. 2880STDY5682894]
MEESQRIKTFIQYRQRVLRCLLSQLCSKVNLTGFRDAAEAHACQQVTGDLHLADHAKLRPVGTRVLIGGASEGCVIFGRIGRSPQRAIYSQECQAIPVR